MKTICRDFSIDQTWICALQRYCIGNTKVSPQFSEIFSTNVRFALDMYTTVGRERTGGMEGIEGIEN